MSELAQLLGEKGIWVEQISTLDSHPLAAGDYGVAPWFPFAPPDAAVRLTRNVVYADNFWRQDRGPISLGDFNGENMGTARNLQLDENLLGGDAVVGDPGYAAEHSDVHLWYHGTIDRRPVQNSAEVRLL